MTNDVASLSIGTLTFNNASAQTYSLSNNALTLTAGLNIANTSSNTVANIGVDLVLNNSSITFNSANNQTLNLNGAISETGASRNVSRGTGGGTINWNGANTFTGTLTLNGGGTNVFNSIADTGSSAIGIGSADIIMVGTGANAGIQFNGSPAGATTRNVVLGGTAAGTAGRVNINNTSTDAANSLTLGGSITSTSSQLKQLYLGGTNTGNNLVSGVISSTGNTLSLVKAGSGTWALSGSNTFTGTIGILQGTLSVANIGSVGSASSNLGAHTTAGDATINMGEGTNSATLRYTGNGETTDRIVNLSGTTGGATINHSGTAVLRITSNMTATGDGNKTLNLTGSGTGSGKRGEFAGVIGNSATGVTTVTKADSGRWALQATNTFTGNVNINNGFLEVSTIGNQGVASNLGAGTTIGFGQGTANGTLEYVGSGETTNRIVDLKTGNTGGGRIDNNGSGALIFTGNTAHTGTTSDKTLTLGGTSTGFINEFNGVINDQTGGQKVGLAKAGASTWSLGGTNTYTGDTTVSAGVLAVDGSLANTTTNVAGTLQGSGTIGGSVTIQDGGTLAPGNSIESLGVASLAFLAGSTYAYELNSSVLNGDLTYSTGTLDIASGVGPLGTTLTLTELFSGTLAVDSKLTLISYTDGWTPTELFNYMGSPLADDSTFTLGANQWLFNYDDTSGGGNFGGDQSGAARFVTMTVIPEPTAAMLGGLGLLTMLRRRRK
jgi:autotransporter-associated beta strand protein